MSNFRLKSELKKAVIDTVEIIISVVPWLVYFVGAYVIAIPEIYINSYDIFMDMNLGEVQTSNLAAIATLFTLAIGAIIMAEILKQLTQEVKKTNDKKVEKKNKAQDQTSSEELREA